MRVARLDRRLWTSPERMRSEQLLVEVLVRVGWIQVADGGARRWESFGVAVPGDSA